MNTGRLTKASPFIVTAVPVQAPVVASTVPAASRSTAGVVPVPGIGVKRR